MSEVAVLDRALSRVVTKDKALRAELDSLKKGLNESTLTQTISDFWRLLFWSANHEIGPSELNILEKMLSHGLITSSTVLVLGQVDGDAVGSSVVINDTVNVLHESLKIAAGLASRPDTELEVIKICLTSCTASKVAIKKDSLKLALNTLLQVIGQTKNSINKSAAKGAVTQIINDRLSQSTDVFEWLSRVRLENADVAVMLLDLYCSAANLWNGSINSVMMFILNCCEFTDKSVFQALLRVLLILLEQQLAEPVELLCHRLLFGQVHDKSSDRIWPLQVQANRTAFLDFVSMHLARKPQLLMNLFCSLDCSSELDGLLEPLLTLLGNLVQGKDHSAVIGSPRTTEDTSFVVSRTSFSTLMTMIRGLLDWAWDEQRIKSDDCTKMQGRIRKEAVGMFNRKPKLGLDFATNNGLINGSLESQAHFLRYTRGLNKTTIGDFISSPGQEDLLAAFIALHSFEDQPFVQALRDVLQLFRLPGEAQKIDRIVEAFAKGYCEGSGNQDLEDNQTLAFQLAFMAVMLNTDLHSPSIKNKMSADAFVENCRGLEKGEEISEQLLRGIYTEVETSEFHLADYYVVTPLPVGARGKATWKEANVAELALLLFSANQRQLTESLSFALGNSDVWPEGSPSLQVINGTGTVGDFFQECLEILEDLLELYLAKGDEAGADPYLSTILSCHAFDPDSIYHGIAIDWLYAFIERNSNSFKKLLWSPIVNALARCDLASAVDEHHNIRTIDLGKLEGSSLLSFIQSLLFIPPEAQHYEAFLKNYALKLENLSSLNYEKLVNWSYSKQTTSIGAGIFSVLAKTFRNQHLRSCSFFLANKICEEQMPMLATANEKALSEFNQALIQFGLDSEAEIAESAIGMFRFVADLLFSAHLKEQKGRKVEREEFLLKWNPIISGLTHVAIHQDNVVISGNAIKMVYEIIRQQGIVYTAENWKRVYRAVFLATIEDLSMQRGRLASELIITSLNWIIEITTDYGPAVLCEPEIDALANILGWIEGMVMRANEQLARSALIAFNQVVTKNYQLFTRLHWDQVVATLGHLVEYTLPVELTEFSTDESDLDNWSRRNSDQTSAVPSPRISAAASGLTQAFSSTSVALMRPDFQAARYKCALQLLILHSVKDMLLNGILGTGKCTLQLDHLEAILGYAEKSATFAHHFNMNIPLRTLLWKAGFLDSFENILLSKQEAASAQLTISVLLRLYTLDQYKKDPRYKEVVDERLRLASLAVLEGYLGLLEDNPAASALRRSIKAWPSVVALVFSGLGSLVKEPQGEVPWIGDLYQPALQIFKLDNGEASTEAYTFLTALSHRYIHANRP